jgi:hypothetical protein
MFGFTSVTNSADSAMDPPMVWITNAKDRSPAELLRVPGAAWGPLGGALLNLSYGTGKSFVVPHEEVGGVWQGVCELPMPAFATGIMRGRFGADARSTVRPVRMGWQRHRARWLPSRASHRPPTHLPLGVHARRKDSSHVQRPLRRRASRPMASR